jgi:hypothetical protein
LTFAIDRAHLGVVIPTMLLIGLVFGRWWRIVIPVAAIVWAGWLVIDGIGSGLPFAASAGLLAAANVGIGVVLFQAMRLAWHSLAAHHSHATD